MGRSWQPSASRLRNRAAWTAVPHPATSPALCPVPVSSPPHSYRRPSSLPPFPLLLACARPVLGRPCFSFPYAPPLLAPLRPITPLGWLLNRHRRCHRVLHHRFASCPRPSLRPLTFSAVSSQPLPAPAPSPTHLSFRPLPTPRQRSPCWWRCAPFLLLPLVPTPPCLLAPHHLSPRPLPPHIPRPLAPAAAVTATGAAAMSHGGRTPERASVVDATALSKKRLRTRSTLPCTLPGLTLHRETSP